MQEMTTKEAVTHVIKEGLVQSKYSLAVHILNVQPIMISNYLKKVRMSTKTADKFELAFDIHITDAYDVRSILDGD